MDAKLQHHFARRKFENWLLENEYPPPMQQRTKKASFSTQSRKLSAHDLDTLLRGHSLTKIWDWVHANVHSEKQIKFIQKRLDEIVVQKKNGNSERKAKESYLTQLRLKKENLQQKMNALDKDINGLHGELGTLEQKAEQRNRQNSIAEQKTILAQAYSAASVEKNIQKYQSCHQSIRSITLSHDGSSRKTKDDEFDCFKPLPKVSYDNDNILSFKETVQKLIAEQKIHDVHGYIVMDTMKTKLIKSPISHSLLKGLDGNQYDNDEDICNNEINYQMKISKLLIKHQKNHVSKFFNSQAILNKARIIEKNLNSRRSSEVHCDHGTSEKDDLVNTIVQLDKIFSIVGASLELAANRYSELSTLIKEGKELQRKRELLVSNIDLCAKLNQNNRHLMSKFIALNKDSLGNIQTIKEEIKSFLERNVEVWKSSLLADIKKIRGIHLSELNCALDVPFDKWDVILCKGKHYQGHFPRSILSMNRFQNVHDSVQLVVQSLKLPVYSSIITLLNALTDGDSRAMERNKIDETTAKAHNTVNNISIQDISEQNSNFEEFQQNLVSRTSLILSLTAKLYAEAIPNLEAHIHDWYVQPAQFCTDRYRTSTTMSRTLSLYKSLQ